MMKVIFHTISVVFCLALVDSALLSDLKSSFLKYLVSSALQPDDGSKDIQQNIISNKRNNVAAKLDEPEDYGVASRKRKNEDWAEKQNYNNNVEPHIPQQYYYSNKSEAEGYKKPMFEAHFRKWDPIDQVIPEVQKKQERGGKISNNYFHMDPVLNSLRRNPSFAYRSHSKSKPKFIFQQDYKNKIEYRRHQNSDSSASSQSSSSREMKNFKDEFREMWLQKKYEAINQSRISGDKVNMVAARPWGVPCGDPNQHDMPWGVCMLHVECEPEYRIYRGDLFCGRTKFICCGLLLTTYDMYQGFDVSFNDNSLSTDSEEKRERDKTSKEKRSKKRERERRKRRKAREKRKKRIKKHIRKIIKEIRKILNRQYRNGTKQRKKRTKQLKKFIKDLKKQYRKDRQSVKDLHESDILHIDSALMARLKQIQKVNQHFARNATFREVVLKGMMTKKVARMLLDAYPELDEFLEARRASGGGVHRRAGGGEPDSSQREDSGYDVEYGYLYY